MNPLKYGKSITKLQRLLSVLLVNKNCQPELSKFITLFYEMHAYYTVHMCACTWTDNFCQCFIL